MTDALFQKASEILTPLFFWACRTYNQTKDYIASDTSLKALTDDIAYYLQRIYFFMTSRRMEPRDAPWISISHLVPNTMSITQTYTFLENYNNFFSNYFSYDLFSGHPDAIYAVKYITIVASRFTANKSSQLLIIKATYPDIPPFYIVRRNDEPVGEITREKSSVKFLSIEYVHPELAEAIELHLDDSWFIVGNHLFTPTFVLRALEYQSVNYIFDNQYKIRIMDSNCDTIEFGADTYIEITKKGYEWKKCLVLKGVDDETYDGDSDTDFVEVDNDSGLLDKGTKEN
jgi:hypothetical protein